MFSTVYLQLITCSEKVADVSGAREAHGVILPLGVAYNSAMEVSEDLRSVSTFREELQKLAQLLSLQVLSLFIVS